MFHRKLAVSLAVLLVLAQVSLACGDERPLPSQAPTTPAGATWEEIKKLAAGAELHVEVDQKHSIRGRFVSASDTALKLEAKKGVVELDKSSIRQIFSVTHRSRSKRTLIGGGIGFGAGVVLAAATIGATEDDTANLAIVTFTFVGAIAGGVIGALSGGKRKGELLYRR